MNKTYLDLTEKGSTPETTFYALHMNEIELRLIDRLLAGVSAPESGTLKQALKYNHIGIDSPTNIYLKQQIGVVDEIETQIKVLREKQKRAAIIISAIKESCPHVNTDGTSAMLFIRKDSHHNYYKCRLCFKEITE